MSIPKKKIPGEEGERWEEHPDKVQGAQPKSEKPIRDSHVQGESRYPDPGNIVDAHIGDSRHP